MEESVAAVCSEERLRGDGARVELAVAEQGGPSGSVDRGSSFDLGILDMDIEIGGFGVLKQD